MLRLDGIDPDYPDEFRPPAVLDTLCPNGRDKALATCWRWAVAHAGQPCLAPDGAASATARWGEQDDVEHLALSGGDLTPAVVCGYFAKYVTKFTTDPGALDRPIRSGTDLADVLPALTPHQARLVRAAGTSAVAARSPTPGCGRTPMPTATAGTG